ncbi:hypothetical protein BpHYR1_033745 [Brachionus plicatilis]|uniref:Uncharacterized protein n=1 Tax=Brachionus plicatilis TaxID=10195 RepID=A0A3M7T224_BRAPC|nr:hypothetical protein BpHYR1_033745 [Brachionus plicatilis]
MTNLIYGFSQKRTTLVKDKEVPILTTEKDQWQRWVEHLGRSTISTELGTHRDIKNRLSKVKFAFARLIPALKSNSYIKETKLKLYNTTPKCTEVNAGGCVNLRGKALTPSTLKACGGFSGYNGLRHCRMLTYTEEQTLSN